MNPPRKVFISPLTRVYLQQYYKVFGGHNSALPLNSHAFNDELYQLLGVAKSRYPRSDRMSGWFKRVKSYLLFVKGIPGILLYYLTNYGSSYSLKEHKFDQLFSPTSWQSQFTQSSAPMEGDGNEATYVAVTRIVNPPAWSQVLSVLNVAHISDSQKQRVQSEITEQLTHIRHQGLLNENEQLLLDWAIYLLGKSAAPSSVRKRLFAIGQRLVALAEGCVIAKKPIDNGGVATVQTKKHLSPEDRLELYRDCLELSVSHQNHENMRGYLHAFEVWLCTECKALPIPYDEEFNLDVNSSKHRVNASLILVDDYQFLFDTLFTLSRNTANEDFSYMLLVLILGFRLGLRRDEIAGLKLDDYLASDHDPFLLLRTSEARSLKTTNAQRYFRLSDHMPKHEWELFNKHYQAIIEHKDEKNKRGRIKYLFPKIERIDTKMNHDRYFTPLMSMIREKVKDDEIKFHQLRHSKASFEFLAAFNAQFDLNIDTLFFSSYPLTAQWISSSKHRLSHAMTSQSHLNKAPFWIHEIMGHGSMMMTLGHYVHTLDMVTAGFMHQQAKKQMSLSWLSALGLIDKNRYYRYPDRIVSLVLADEKKRLQSIQSAQIQMDVKESKKLQPIVTSGETANHSNDLSRNNPMVDSHLFNYLPYKLYQLLISQHDVTQLALLTDKFGLTSQQVQDYLQFTKAHPKLLFQQVAKNQKAILLKTLQEIERVYDVSLQQKELPLVLPEKLKADLDLFEKRLKVRTRTENAIEWVSQYELRCFTKEDVVALVNCIEVLGYEASITVFYPTDDTQKLAKVQQYWQQTLTRKDVEYRHESLSNKYGRAHISATINGKKIQAFYLAMAMTFLSIESSR
jgi:integrase